MDTPVLFPNENIWNKGEQSAPIHGSLNLYFGESLESSCNYDCITLVSEALRHFWVERIRW